MGYTPRSLGIPPKLKIGLVSHCAVVTPVLLGVRSVLALRHWMLSQEIRSQESWKWLGDVRGRRSVSAALGRSDLLPLAIPAHEAVILRRYVDLGIRNLGGISL